MIHLLASILSARRPIYPAALLHAAAEHPLVRSGLLRHLGNLRPLDRCPGCNDCDFAPIPYYLDDGRTVEAMCPTHCRVIKLTRWQCGDVEFDEPKFVALLSAALECETPRTEKGGQIVSLGLCARPIGNHRRKILFQRRYDPASLPTDDKSFLLIVGSAAEFTIADEQLARRVFRLSDILRIDERGTFEVLFDVLTSRFEDSSLPKPKSLNRPAADKVADFYKDKFFLLFEMRNGDNDFDYERILEAMKPFAKHTSQAIVDEIGVRAGTISKVLSNKDKASDPCAHFWYSATTNWNVFDKVGKFFLPKHTTQLRKNSARKLFDTHNLDILLGHIKGGAV